MKKLLLLIASFCFVWANAQNSGTPSTKKANIQKQSVREMALKKSPDFKRHHDRMKKAKMMNVQNNSNPNKNLDSTNTGCFYYETYSHITHFYAGGNSTDTIVAWAWDFGDGGADSTTNDGTSSHYYFQPNGGGVNTYYACLTTTNNHGISSTCCDSVYVYYDSSCYSNFSYSADMSNLVTFGDYSYSSDTIISWAWDFGDSTGSTDQNPTHQYSASGTYNVCLTTASNNGCSNNYCYSVNVNDNPITCSAYFSAYGDSLNYYFSDMSSTSTGTIVSWLWDFGDNTASMDQNPIHLYTQAGTFNVCVTTTSDNNCSATFCNLVYVNQNPNVIVDTITNLTQTLSAMLFGSCVSVSNLTYTGAPEAVGYFLDNGSSIDSSFNYGLVLSSGNVHNIVGPNNSTGASADNQLPGDTDLDALIPSYTTYDAAIIEFDFTSVSDTIIASKIVFSSEEYPEFVGTSFNDVFGFYISGPGITGVKNLAVIPNTTDAISVNTVNPNLNTSYYVDNTNGVPYQFDGRTTVIELSQAITAGQTYHFKIAIADAGDHVLDSWVLIKAGSFNGNTQMPDAQFAVTNSGSQGLTVNMNNLSTDANLYAWDFGDNSPIDITSNPNHTYATAGTYTVTLVASNVCYTDSTSMVITVGASGIAQLNANNRIQIVPTSSEGVYNAMVQSTSNEKVQVKVFSMNGQLVVNDSRNISAGLNNYSLDLSSFASGVYTVQIVGSKEVFSSKLIR